MNDLFGDFVPVQRQEFLFLMGGVPPFFPLTLNSSNFPKSNRTPGIVLYFKLDIHFIFHMIQVLDSQ
ncbi:hypothetical protein LDL77_08440 [Flagellimonas marinaquae]|uniref:hypothetical protein n=1 Tax=Flagellimonas aurea TaxID=2915619 RepID=UPI001CE1FEF5|nr:hypothetical protein [Allomuricauda aurea]UBZ15732.1 hypothetical protein LDL77_08440 [Allomuricauda aquimarina]